MVGIMYCLIRRAIPSRQLDSNRQATLTNLAIKVIGFSQIYRDGRQKIIILQNQPMITIQFQDYHSLNQIIRNVVYVSKILQINTLWCLVVIQAHAGYVSKKLKNVLSVLLQ